MEKIKEAWINLHNRIVDVFHACFAQSLLDEIARRKGYYLDILETYIILNADFQKEKTNTLAAQKEVEAMHRRQNIENSDGAIAVQVIKERMHEGAFSAQSHALKQRNAELIRENDRLQNLLRKYGN